MSTAAAQLTQQLWGRGYEQVGGMNGSSPYSNTGERTRNSKHSGTCESPRIAFIDYLTFTFPAWKLKTLNLDQDKKTVSYDIWKLILNDFGLDMAHEVSKGRNGYQNHTKILAPINGGKQFAEVGYYAWGGNNDTVCVSLSGQGCQFIGSHGFSLIRETLEDLTGKITRIDLAHDCFNGDIDLETVRQWYKLGLFKANSRGKYPNKKELLGGEDGSTIYVGSRESGKYFRAYEKGRQLGDKNSKWVRLELELHSTKRHIPYEILDKISDYLSGAYECMTFLSEEQSRIKTQQKTESISFAHLETHCKKAYGRFIEVMLQVYDGCPATVVEQLRRDDGIPSRLLSSSIPIRE
jgi:DNA relaxase NicK